MKKVKKTVRFLIETIISTAIVGLVLVVLLDSTILNERYVLTTFEKTNYYSKIHNLVESNFKNYIQQSGLQEEILNNIVSEEKIKDDTKKIVVNLYDVFYEEVTTTEIRDNLKRNIYESLENRKLTEEEKNAIEGFIDEICNEYTATLSYVIYSKEINENFTKIMKYIKIVKKGLIILIGVLAIVTVLLNKKKFYRMVTDLAITLVSSGVILIVFYSYINLNLNIKYINILNDAISDIIRNILGYIVNSILTAGILLSITGIISMIFANLIHNYNKYNIKKK